LQGQLDVANRGQYDGNGHGGSGRHSTQRAVNRDIVEGKAAGDGRYGSSEANEVIANYTALSASAKQDLLNFLRSL
jgi:hypothetical protein